MLLILGYDAAHRHGHPHGVLEAFGVEREVDGWQLPLNVALARMLHLLHLPRGA